MRLIDADELREHISELLLVYSGKEILDAIDKAPTVERPHGEWENCGGMFCARCSVCKEVEYETIGNFCPNCGADMREEGEAE